MPRLSAVPFVFRRGLIAIILSFAVIGISSFVFRSQAGTVDPTFNANVETATFLQKEVSGVFPMPDGKIVVSGIFNRYNGQPVGGMVRLNSDGTLDPTFNNHLIQSPAFVRAAPFGNGKLLVTGCSGNPPQVCGLRLLSSSGNVDPGFSHALTGHISGVDVDQSGRIIVFGNLSYTLNGNTVSRSIVRLMPDGMLDPSFDGQPEVTGRFVTLAAQDNKILYVFETLQGFVLRRLNTDGSPDATFQPVLPGSLAIQKIKVDSTNKIVVLTSDKVIKLNEDGSVDPTFTIPPAFSMPRDLVVQTDGRITVGHRQSSPESTRIFRVLPNGTPDPSFTTYLNIDNGAPDPIGVQEDGAVVIGDQQSQFGLPQNNFKRLLPSGALDTGFNVGGSGFQSQTLGAIRAIKVLPDGKIMIGGDFHRVGGLERRVIARMNPDGSVDPTFQVSLTGTGNRFIFLNKVYNITMQSDGKLLVSGQFGYLVNGVERQGVVRLLPNGAIDPGFFPSVVIIDLFDLNGFSTNRPIQRPDGKVLVGYSQGSGQDPISPPLLLATDGTRDASFNPPIFPLGSFACIYDLAVQPDGKILIGGKMDASGGAAQGILARLNSDGTTDTSFAVYTPANKRIWAIALLPNGQVLAVVRETAGPSTILRFNANGTIDTSFSTGAGSNGKINAIKVMPDGRILVGGLFTLYNGVARQNLAVLNSEGVLGSSVVEPDGEVLCVDLDDQDRLLIGGRFTLIRSSNQQLGVTFIARFEVSRRTPFDFDGDGKTDYSVFRPTVGRWIVQRSQAGYLAGPWGLGTDTLVPADYDGDGKTDFAVYRPSNGEWSILRSSNGTIFIGRFGASEDFPRPADFDGDGRADINVFRPSLGAWYRINSGNNQFVAHIFGQSGDVPLIADFDGDQRSDVAVYRPSDGTWYWLRSSNGQFNAGRFGIAEDVPIPADFDGDGKSDLSVFRPSTGYWFRLESGTGAFVPVPWGESTDKPVVGDYDGDGKADIAVWRPSNGVFYTLRTNGNQYVAYPFGATTDLPIASVYGR